MRRMICVILACALLCWNPDICRAVEYEGTRGNNSEGVIWANAHYNMSVGPQSSRAASNSIFLEAGEIVRIQATFSPMSSNISVGLIDSNGIFYSISITGGVVDVALRIEERGEYRFAVKNNSLYVLTISGNVNFG